MRKRRRVLSVGLDVLHPALRSSLIQQRVMHWGEVVYNAAILPTSLKFVNGQIWHVFASTMWPTLTAIIASLIDKSIFGCSKPADGRDAIMGPETARQQLKLLTTLQILGPILALAALITFVDSRKQEAESSYFKILQSQT
jgi:hypothetical protein